MNKNGLSKKFWYVLITVFIVLIILVAIGFIVFANRKEEVIENTENGGNIVLNYTNNVSGLSVINTIPVSDAVGMKNMNDGEYFDFSIDVSLDNATNIDYEIAALKDKKNSTISDDDIRIYLEQEKSGSYTSVFEPSKFTPIKDDSDLGSPKGSMILAQVNKTKSVTDNYRLRIWLSDKSLLSTGSYSLEILVNGKAK